MSPLHSPFAPLAAAFLLAHANPVLATDCVTEFRVGAAPDHGTAFTGFSSQPGSAEAHFAAVQAVLEREGWSVTTKDAVNRAVLARNGQRTAGGKTGTLGLSFADAQGGGVSVALMYNNPPGVQSPAAAVREQFCKIATGVATAAAPQDGTMPAAAAPAEGAAGRQLCLARACLGMTAAQVAALDLQPPPTVKFRFHAGYDNAYGLDPAGGRVTFSDMGEVDSKLLRQFASTVKTICAMSFASARLRASDGQPIRLVLRPTIRDGKGVLVLTQIDRSLPANLSASERQRFEAAPRAQYGDAFSAAFPTTFSEPAAGIEEGGTGRALRLSLPHETNVAAQLLEQPGCSATPRLD
ncbi:hypothetical protein [Massilia sp. METH4]|uniref:hypothetical protein n=1 Tax=Massilia sp. METH4 TaxID=3123041 RepID=UPI0030CD6104